MIARVFAVSLAFATLFGATRAPCEPKGAEPDAARASLVWIYGDDDALSPPDARVPTSPAASIGDRPGYDLLATGYRSRYTGRENRVEVHLRGAAPGFFSGLSTRAELALGIDASSFGERDGGSAGAPIRAEDVGSFLEARIGLAGASPCPPEPPTSSVAVRLYPLDGDRERVGWLEALGWGGATGPRRESPYTTARGPVRAGRLEISTLGLDAFIGLKTASFVEPVPNAPAIEETSYGVYAGLAARPAVLAELAVAGGYFEHGVLERAARGARAATAGASARLALRRGMDEPRSPGAFLGPDDDPFRAVPDALPGAFALGAEGAALVQRLADFDRPGETTLAKARALAFFGGARLGPFELGAALVIRDASFVMRAVPGVFPGQTIPHDALEESERSVFLSNGLVLSELARVDLGLSLRFPAAVMLGALDRLGQPTGTTMVVNAPGDVQLLPPGAVPVPVFEARPAFEMRLSRLLSAVAWIAYRRDYNRTKLVAVAGEVAPRGFADPDRVGYGVAARAVW